MTVQSKSGPRADTARLERELLQRLGLTSDANAQDIETAHDDLVKFLEGAPHELRDWAAREIAGVDEAYALLSDPTADLAALAAASAVAPSSAATRSVDTPASAVVPVAAGAAPTTVRRRNRTVLRAGIAAAVVVGVVAIAIVGYNAGAPSVPGFTGTPAPEASNAAQVDQARVAELMQKIATDPKDVTALQALGDIYFAAGDYDTAGGWMEKILAVEPNNITARLALGAALFNVGKSAEAETQWRLVLRVDPQNLEAHYDLGFMYLSKDPPDMASVKAEWTKVIEIAPDSDVAKTVQQHLTSFESAAPGGTASPSSSPAASPVASPAVSPAGSPSASPSASGG